MSAGSLPCSNAIILEHPPFTVRVVGRKLNRLLTVINTDTKVKFTYDYMGRRHKKVVYERSGGSWSPVQTNLFVYDGWNPIQETVISSSGTVTNWYVWGLDLSGEWH